MACDQFQKKKLRGFWDPLVCGGPRCVVVLVGGGVALLCQFLELWVLWW